MVVSMGRRAGVGGGGFPMRPPSGPPELAHQSIAPSVGLGTSNPRGISYGNKNDRPQGEMVRMLLGCCIPDHGIAGADPLPRLDLHHHAPHPSSPQLPSQRIGTAH